MAQASCGGSVQLCALRVAKLAGNGVPQPGTGNLYVTNAMIQLTVESEFSEGEDFEQKNGCGEVAVSLKDIDRIKRLNLGLQLATPDPELTQMLVGGQTISSGGSVIGYAYPEIDNQPVPNGVSMEAFSKRIVGGALATDYPYWKWVFGKTSWSLGDRTMGNEIMVTNFSGFAEENPNFYNGPANDWPYTSDRVLQYAAVTAIPATSCGAQTLSAS